MKAAMTDSDRGWPGSRSVSASIWTAHAWCLGILVVAYALAMATYRRKIA